MLKLKNKTTKLSLIGKTVGLSMKNKITKLSLIGKTVGLSMKNETIVLSFNLKVYNQYHPEFYKLLELFDNGVYDYEI